jgi:hypothetical protein
MTISDSSSSTIGTALRRGEIGLLFWWYGLRFRLRSELTFFNLPDPVDVEGGESSSTEPG